MTPLEQALAALSIILTTCDEPAQQAAIDHLTGLATIAAYTDPVLGGLLLAYATNAINSGDPAQVEIGLQILSALGPLAAPAVSLIELVFQGVTGNPEQQAAALILLANLQYPGIVGAVQLALLDPNENLRLAALNAIQVYQFYNGGGQSLFGAIVSGAINDPNCSIAVRAAAAQSQLFLGL